jgi:hypothetical protein
MKAERIEELIELTNRALSKIHYLEQQIRRADSVESDRVKPILAYRIEKNILQFQMASGEWGDAIDLRKLKKGGGGGTVVIAVDQAGTLVSNRVDEINFVDAIVTTNVDNQGYRKVNVSLGSGFVPPLPPDQTYIGNLLNQPIATACEQWVLLESIDITNQLQVDISLSPPYEEFKIEVRKLIPITNNGNFVMLWSADGGNSYLNTGYRNVTQSSSPGSNLTFSSFDDTLDEVTILEGCGNSTGESIMSDIQFYNPLDSTLFTICKLDSSYVTDDVDVHTLQGTATNTLIDPIDAVRFMFSNGGIQSGLIRVYGKIN